MSRRRGQTGSINISGKWYRVRLWMDVPGSDKRMFKSERICPTAGPGFVNQSQRERKAKKIIADSGADDPETLAASIASVDGTKFKQQASSWLASMKKMDQAPSTTETWDCCIENWLNPYIGDLPLDSIKKTVAQGLIDKMVAGGLSPKTVNNYFQVVKMVVGSVTNEDGEALHPRNWKAMKLVIPEVIAKDQRRPVFSREAVSALASPFVTKKNGKKIRIKPKMRMLFILCAASGLRIGEALGLRVEKVKDNGASIIIDSKVWKNQEHDYLKTVNGEREVDLHSSVAKLLVEFIGKRTEGLVVQTKAGKPLHQSNILRRVLHPVLEAIGQPKAGAHAFRRFRNTYLRNSTSCPDGILKFWMGHGANGMSDLYDRIREDRNFRKEVAERVGVGFDVAAQLNLIEPKIESMVAEEVL